MTLSFDIIKNLYGFSLAKYSTWFYYKSDKILFDVGEGVSVSMRNMVYGINSIFISHGHGDHIGGLPGLLKTRSSSMGNQKKTISIYYPLGDKNINELYNYIKNTMKNIPFEICWKGLKAGDRVKLGETRLIEAFPSYHSKNNITLGYKLIEKRNRLKECYRGLSQEQLLKLIKKNGRQYLTEQYSKPLLCYSGDSMPLSKEIINNTEVLLHDTTFIDKKDRNENTHASLSEVFELVHDANISLLGLFHLSARYHHNFIVSQIQNKIKEFQINVPVFYIFKFIKAINFKKI